MVIPAESAVTHSSGPAIARSVGQYALTLWIALTLNFALPRLAPGDPLEFLIGGEAGTLSLPQRARVTHELGLDRPLITQYARYLGGIASGNLGNSFRYGRPVTGILVERVGWTLLLLVPALLLGAIVGTMLGAAAAWRRGSAGEVALLGGVLALDALPVFWIGMVLIAVFVGALGWLPTFGLLSMDLTNGAALASIGRRLVLPLATLTIVGVGHTFLVARAAMLTALAEDYVTFAAARGLRERTIVLRHALPNALLPIYTNVALGVGALVSGAVLIETLFAWPGLGRLITDAIAARDYPLLQGALLLVVVGTVGANLLADASYHLVDPRVRRPGAARLG